MFEKGDEFELQLHELIRAALRQKQTYEDEKHEAEEKLRDVDAALAAYDRTSNDYRKQKGLPVRTNTITATRLCSMTVAAGMEAMLREAGGKERVAVMARRLLEAGKLKNKKTMYPRIRGTAQKDQRFKLLKGGWIQLVEAEAQELGEGAG